MGLSEILKTEYPKFQWLFLIFPITMLTGGYTSFLDTPSYHVNLVIHHIISQAHSIFLFVNHHRMLTFIG